ncbi:MAG: host-nuclease inhibitor Gam family protein [Kiritimatiellae bacterium]|nr:host-nuclease inhibitor Gam family protein [Kiritimatiellia bacterium]
MPIDSLEDADAVMRTIAISRGQIDLEKARAVSLIAEIKAMYEKKIALPDAILKASAARLQEFAREHPEHFQRPRIRVTDWGSYGFRKSKRLEIDDEDVLFETLVDAYRHNPRKFAACLKVEKALVKDQIKRCLEETPGCLEGARVEETDNFSCSPKPGVTEQPKVEIPADAAGE